MRRKWQKLWQIKTFTPTLPTVLGKKEDELRSLKSEAAELDRKIALTLTPPEEKTEETEKEKMKQVEGLSSNNHSVGKGNDNLSVQDAKEEKHSQSFKPKWRHYP